MKRTARRLPYTAFEHHQICNLDIAAAEPQADGPGEPNGRETGQDSMSKDMWKSTVLTIKVWEMWSQIIRKIWAFKWYKDHWRVISKNIRLIPRLTVYPNQLQVEQRLKFFFTSLEGKKTVQILDANMGEFLYNLGVGSL